MLDTNKPFALPSFYRGPVKPDNCANSMEGLFIVAFFMCKHFAVLSLLAINIVATHVAQAQIFDCGGTWTNHPCPGGTKVMNEVSQLPSKRTADQEAKKDIVHSLTKARYQAKERFDVDSDSSGAERFCELELTSVDDCQKRVDDYLGKLDNRVIEEEKLKLQRREIELAEEKLAQQKKGSANVIIIRNGVLTPYPTYYLPPNPNFTAHFGAKPPHVPAPSRNEVPNDARVPR